MKRNRGRTVKGILAGCLAGGLVLGSMAAQAAEDFKPVELSAYARAGLKVGKSGKSGDRIDETGGFARNTRLLEGQYFELGVNNNLSKDNHFKVTVAMGGDTFHCNNVWTSADNQFALRDMFFEMKKTPADPRLGLWFGSRMYRGDDIYLYDHWPLDNQNLLGGGVSFSDHNTYEFAIGAKKDNTFGAVNSSDNPFTYSTQRFILIQKTTFPLPGDRKFKTNVEFNFIPAGTGILTANSTTKYTLDTPAAAGVMIGGQFTYTPGHSVFLNYGYGPVAGGVETPASPVLNAVQANGQRVDTSGLLKSNKNSQILDLALGGSQELLEAPVGVLYGAVARAARPMHAGKTGTALSAAVRPMYYVTDAVHAGVQFDGIAYGSKLSDSDVSYLQVAPMIEYAMNKNAYGSPKFRLIASNVFYAKPVTKFDTTSKHAFTLAGGFELWF